MKGLKKNLLSSLLFVFLFSVMGFSNDLIRVVVQTIIKTA